MSQRHLFWIISLGLFPTSALLAQTSQQSHPTGTTSVPRRVRINSTFHPVSGSAASPFEGAVLSIYPTETGGTPLWQETQNVAIDNDGHYSGGVCKPVSERTQEVGCWILADDQIGKFAGSPVFWHLDGYSTRAAAQIDKGPHGIVIESLGKIWLMTIEGESWRPAHGIRIARIGPLSIIAKKKYSAQYMEAVFAPGMTAPEHVHSGPEAWFTLAGETCLESSDGRVQFGRAGGPAVIVPAGLSMHLTATGTEQRRALVLILHESSKPPTTLVHDWTPKGLCAHAK